MAQILIRNISDDVHARLKEKAASEGKSVQAYVKGMLESSVRPSMGEFLEAAAAIRKSYRGPPISTEAFQAILDENRRELDERTSRVLFSEEDKAE
jgi:plasmid stability protein